MLGHAWNTQDGYARDLKAFLNFLWRNRNRTSCRDATAADHLAYPAWRRKDPQLRRSAGGYAAACCSAVVFS